MELYTYIIRITKIYENLLRRSRRNYRPPGHHTSVQLATALCFPQHDPPK